MSPSEANELASIASHLWREESACSKICAKHIAGLLPPSHRHGDVAAILFEAPEKTYSRNIMEEPGIRSRYDWLSMWPEKLHELNSMDLPQSWRDHANLWPLEIN